jgi:hypothetical protein
MIDKTNHQHPRSQDPPFATGRASCESEPFVIAKAGKPLVKVTALDAPIAGQVRRLGFLAGRMVPDDFDQMGHAEVEKLFGMEA